MKPIYKLRSWIDPKNLIKLELSKNPHDGAVQMMKENPSLIDIYGLSYNNNPEAFKLWKDYTGVKSRAWLSGNSLDEAFDTFLGFVEEMKENDKKEIDDKNKNELEHKYDSFLTWRDIIYWPDICSNTNPKAIEFLRGNLDYIRDLGWENLCANPSEKAMKLVDDSGREPNWTGLCRNSKRYEYIRDSLQRQYHIYYSVSFYANSHDSALDAIEKQIAILGGDEFTYNKQLCANENPRAMDIIKRNISCIDWNLLSRNPEIFELDYTRMKEQMFSMKKELAELVWKPERLARMIELHGKGQTLLDFLDSLE